MREDRAPVGFTIRDACAYAGVSRSYLYQLLAAGQITAKKAGRHTIVDGDSLRAWHASLPAFKSAA